VVGVTTSQRDASAVVTLSVDIGGTKVAAGLIDQGGAVLAREERATVVDGGRDPEFAVSLPLARALTDEARRRGHVLDGVGVCVPEYVTASGLVTSNEVMPWDVQPADAFAALGRVTVSSDVQCAGIAEARVGAAAGRASCLYVTVSTGISSSLVLDGRLWAGSRGEAIAFGELPVARESGADVEHSLEQFASGDAMARRYRASGNDAAGAHDVVAAALAGDGEARDVLRSSAVAVAHALAWAVALVDPACVVLGGGIGISSGMWADLVDERYLRLVDRRPGGPPLLRAQLGADAALVGAALVHRDRVAPAPR
jgi:glucokinase